MTTLIFTIAGVWFASILAGLPLFASMGIAAFAFVHFGGLADSIVPQKMINTVNSFPLVAAPLFILMGNILTAARINDRIVAFATSLVGWLRGGYAHASVLASMIFAGMVGSAVADAAGVGAIEIKSMKRVGYKPETAAAITAASATIGPIIPPSLPMVIYGVTADVSIGRLFLAGVMPGLMLTLLFMAWTIGYLWLKGFRAYAADFRYSWREKLQSIPKVAPFLAIVFGVMYVLYGGIATPSEAAGVGAALCVLLAMLIYRIWKPLAWWAILRDTTRESVMILMIIGTAVLFSYMLSSLFITQTLAQAIADLQVNRWVLMLLINVFLLICGLFIPPAGIILMTSPILLPIILHAGFDPVWFGVIVTINLEVGLITPPVGLNLFVVNAIAPEVPTRTVLLGALPYVIAMLLGIVILCIFPGIATWLPDTLMGPAVGPGR